MDFEGVLCVPLNDPSVFPLFIYNAFDHTMPCESLFCLPLDCLGHVVQRIFLGSSSVFIDFFIFTFLALLREKNGRGLWVGPPVF